MNRHEFFEFLAPYVVQVRLEGSFIFPSIRLAQNLLETGGIIHPWNNLGGIKVGNGQPNEWWDDSSVNKTTWEVVDGMRVDTSANFRAYKSVYHFYKDQDLLFQLPRYERVRQAMTPEEQAAMLQVCGYATDPDYPRKLVSIMNAYDLKKYDREAEEMLEKLMEQMERLVTTNDELQRRLTDLEAKQPRPINKQKVASWAQEGYKYVTTPQDGVAISDGSRPEDFVTRQEVWTMLKRTHRPNV